MVRPLTQYYSSPKTIATASASAKAWPAAHAGAATDPEIQHFVAYSDNLAEQARLAQRAGESHAGAASSAVSARPDQLAQIKDASSR